MALTFSGFIKNYFYLESLVFSGKRFLRARLINQVGPLF